MSWPLASFALVAVVLGVGWVAYERSRPSAHMMAVVGTLAALAALGRDAFAALPDVKPITAMTLVVGYALGPLPGFSVGAIGMLASNIVLGEGSYTPWQMTAWGAVGLMGAGVGALSGRHLGRVGIAIACGLSAAGAKEIMNVYQWTIGASHSWSALLLVATTSAPYDITDTVASFLFGLAFGPELARLLGRMRTRMTITWAPIAPLVLIALALLPVGVARADLRRPLAFLEHAQNGDGGFGAEPGVRSSELYSAWAALGVAAAGRDPVHLEHGGHSVLDAIRAQAATLQGAGDLERTILALRACGVPARLPGQGSLTTRLLHYRSSDGSFGDLVNITSFAVLALRAAGRPQGDPVVASAAAWLAAQQGANGGFGYAGHGAPDVDDTAAAIQALAAADAGNGGRIGHAIDFLLGARNRDGGFPQQPGGESNAQSTAWAVQALVAAHRNPAAVMRGAARSPIGYLESLIASDGSMRYSRTVTQTPVWVTAQALTALARQPLPVAPGQRSVAGAARSSDARRAPSAHGKPVSGPGSRMRDGLHRAGRAHAGSRAAARAMPGPTEPGVDALAHAVGALIGVLLDPLEIGAPS
ncbi:MAG: prenyltransferase/squalene oxidase repeat-containing protein [Solirubrobacteraceae bacterium]